jgi:hypothetical protein
MNTKERAMKRNIINTTLLLSLFAMFSCAEIEREPVAGLLDSPELLTPDGGAAYVLTEETANDTLMSFTWSGADYGFPAAVNYELQMDVSGGDFSNSATIASTSNMEASITVGDMNSLLSNILSVSPNVASDVDLRIVGMLHETLDTATSETLTLTLTPYSVEVTYPVIYVPGSYQDWDPAGAPTLASADFDDTYEGYVNFADAGVNFKFTEGPNWDVNWGDTDADGTLDVGGDDIVAADAGYYKMIVDVSGLTYTITNTDWGLIGSATPDGWDADQDMTYDEVTMVWTITIDLILGDVKFRANDDWAINYGSDNADGFLEQDGADISVPEAGNYTITMDLSKAPMYAYSLVKN